MKFKYFFFSLVFGRGFYAMWIVEMSVGMIVSLFETVDFYSMRR